MKAKRYTPRIKTATTVYDSLVTLCEGPAQSNADLVVAIAEGAASVSTVTLRRELLQFEAEAADIFRAAGKDPDGYMEVINGVSSTIGTAENPPPISKLEHAAVILHEVAAVRSAVARGDATGAALHALRIGQEYELATVLAMELSYRIGERHRQAPGVSDEERLAMQAAADPIWREDPKLSKLKVAQRIAPKFAPWAADTIRKKITKPGKAV